MTPMRSTTSERKCSPLVDGGFLVLWNHETADGSHEDMLVKHFDATGTQVGSEFWSPRHRRARNADFVSDVRRIRRACPATSLLVAMTTRSPYKRQIQTLYRSTCISWCAGGAATDRVGTGRSA